MKGKEIVKYLEVKLKYPETRMRALHSSLAKKNTTLEQELMNALEGLYKKHVKVDVREFIEEIEQE